MKKWLLALILLASVATAAWANVTTPGTNSGQTISILTVASGVTTDTTTDTVSGVLGNKTYWGQVIGTGAVTQTQAIYGDVDNDGDEQPKYPKAVGDVYPAGKRLSTGKGVSGQGQQDGLCRS